MAPNQTLTSKRITSSLTAHKWQKWKSRFPTCHRYRIYREEAVGLKSSNFTLKITILVNMWNFGAISWKFDSFAHMRHIWLWLSAATTFFFLLNQFSVKYRFPFWVWCFDRTHQELFKDRFLKQNPIAFSRKIRGSNNSLTRIENNFRFLR